MTDHTQALEWRAECQAWARQQAVSEARKAWDVQVAKQMPFNFRWEHVQQVVRLAAWLARETTADAEIVEAAAWLHDVSKGEPKHGIAGAKKARMILCETDFPHAKIDAVAVAIAVHVGLYRPEDASPLSPVEAAVLWDADKLTKLGVQALAYQLSTPFTSGLDLAQRRQVMDEYTRSVLPRTVRSMNTAPARAEAERRHAAMINFLATWEQEAEQGEQP